MIVELTVHKMCIQIEQDKHRMKFAVKLKFCQTLKTRLGIESDQFECWQIR